MTGILAGCSTVLDASLGRPASGIQVQLQSLGRAGTQSFEYIAEGITNADGRCLNLLEPGTKLETGIYRITFQTLQYFLAQDIDSFYPVIEITFRYSNPEEHYHIPLLLSAHSYTTYRGS